MTIDRRPVRSLYFAGINAACLHRFPALLDLWLPGGTRHGQEYVVRNPRRADRRPGSFRINLQTGRWADFATNDRGGDAVSLYAYLNGLSQSNAAQELVKEWGCA